MLIHRAPVIARFTRSDATRLGLAAGILILVMTAILGADILPEESIQYAPGDIARGDIVAPGPASFDSEALTEEAREAAERTSRSSTPTRPTPRSRSRPSRRRRSSAGSTTSIPPSAPRS